MREHRQHLRSAAIIKVNYSSHGALQMDYAQNISRGGLFLATDTEFEMNQRIELHLKSSSLQKPIAVPGIVRWIGERGVPPVRGIGVQFTLEDPEVKQEIEIMVNRIEEPEQVLNTHEAEGVLVYLLEPNEFAAKLYAEGIAKMAQREDSELNGPIRVQSFSDAASVLSAIENTPCDVLITELKTKDVDGVQVIRQIRESYGEQLPIFGISRPFPRDRYEALEAGATAFLNKPLQMRTLFNTLLICLQDASY